MADDEITAEEMKEIEKYTDSLVNGARRLSDNMSLLDVKFDIAGESIAKLKKDTFSQVKDLQDDLRQLSDSVKETQKAILMIISTMKSAVKKEDFARLEKRTDTWAPHTLVTRREAEKVLSKE